MVLKKRLPVRSGRLVEPTKPRYTRFMTKKRTGFGCGARGSAVISVIFALSSAASANAGSALPRFGSFPESWLSGTADIYPIESAPASLRKEAWYALRTISKRESGEKIVIEGFGTSPQSAQKLKRYLSEHHKFSPSRIEILNREIEESAPSWWGWVVIRPERQKLPLRPDHKLVAEFSPHFEELQLLANTVVPASVASSTSVARSPAVVTDELSIRQSSAESRAESSKFLGSDGIAFRPTVGLGWMGVEGAKGLSDKRVQAGWMGVQAQGEFALLRWRVAELGTSAQVFRSTVAVTPDARTRSLTQWGAQGYFLLKANTLTQGIPRIRLLGGYFSNSRKYSGAGRSGFIPAMNGPKAGAELSTPIDHIFLVGVHGAYAWAEAGLLEAGLFLQQNFSETWGLRFQFNANLASAKDGVVRYNEAWSSFQVGMSGNF